MYFFCRFRASAYTNTNVDRLCAVFLYNVERSATKVCPEIIFDESFESVIGCHFTSITV